MSENTVGCIYNNKKYMLKMKLHLLCEKEDKVIFQHVQFDAFKYTHICLPKSTYVYPHIPAHINLRLPTCQP